ncbi:transposase [Aeromonas caviae]
MGLQFGLEDVIANSQGNCLAIRNTRCLKKPGRFTELRRRKIKAVIPQRSDQQRHHKGRPLVLDKARYRRRNVVERGFGWLKKFRRFSTRYEKLAGSFAAFIKLAFCLSYLRELLVDRKPAF